MGVSRWPRALARFGMPALAAGMLLLASPLTVLAGVVDTDGDGLPDALEATLGTDPNDRDTDADGADDGNEFGAGSDPLDAGSFPDADSDGVTDQQDVCPALADPGQADADADGLGDACNDDDDRDGDEWSDALDNCLIIANSDQSDSNANEIGDVCDTDLDGDGFAEQGAFGDQQRISDGVAAPLFGYATDLDGDGDADVLAAFPGPDKIAWYENTDGLGSFGPEQVITTLADTALAVFAADLDGDGDRDVLSASLSDHEIAWYENTNGLGSFGPALAIPTTADYAAFVRSADLDGDGDADVLSASTDDDKIAWYENTDFAGTFGGEIVIATDAIGAQSVFAIDFDGDGDLDLLATSVSDREVVWYENIGFDNCPVDPNPLQVDTDGDGQGDVCDLDDDDLDGVLNDVDNCKDDANPGQEDLDGDDIGDVCDPDRDNDGALNAADAFPDDGSETVDTDSDGVGDNADVWPEDPAEHTDTDGDGIGNNTDGDDDDDTLGDSVEAALGTDPLDADSDDDDLTDGTEVVGGTDPLDPDTDGDGADDGYEIAEGTDPLDPDSTPIPEPGLDALSAVALFTLALLHRSRRRRR